MTTDARDLAEAALVLRERLYERWFAHRYPGEPGHGYRHDPALARRIERAADLIRQAARILDEK
jgi:hypothetical protein